MHQYEGGAQYYLPPTSSIIAGSESKEHHKRYIDFSQNSMQINHPSSSTANSSQINTSQVKQSSQNDSLQQNQVETVNVKQYLMSQQNSLKKVNSQLGGIHSQNSQREANFNTIKRNILGDILNTQHQTHEITSKKSSQATTPKGNGNTTPVSFFKCDQFNESLNRINKLKDKYSYIDKKQYDQAESYQMGSLNRNTSRASFVESEQSSNSQRILERVQSANIFPEQQLQQMKQINMQNSAYPSRGQSPFNSKQNDHNQSYNQLPRSSNNIVEEKKYKQYFIESAIESERLSREQETLKDENEKLRFRLRELLRISQIQTGDLEAKHNHSLTPTSKQKNQIDSRETFPRNQSIERITSHSSLSNQNKENQQHLQQNQNPDKKRGKSQWVDHNNESINMKKELEECVLLLESGRQKIDSLKYSINEKESLIKQSKDYTSNLENKIRKLEKENSELKNTIEVMNRQKSQSLNLIEQISIDGYQEHLKDQIAKQFNTKFVDFLVSQQKLMFEVAQESQSNLEEIGNAIFKLAQNLDFGQSKKIEQDINVYRIQLLRYTKEELSKIKQMMLQKLNWTEDMLDIQCDLNLDKYKIDKSALAQTQNTYICQSCLSGNGSDTKRSHTKNQDSFQQYLMKNNGKDSLCQSQQSIKTSETKQNKQIINATVSASNQSKQTSLYEEQELLQMILLQAQSLEHIFKDQQYS